MITNHDRSYWIGASDTAMVMGNWSTTTWEKWWRQKLALNKDRFETEAMKVGTAFEHRILDFIKSDGVFLTKDTQVCLPAYGLRVNYDGTGHNEKMERMIWEVKTSSRPFKVSKAYWQQAQVEMLAWKLCHGVLPKLEIVAYQVTEEDYKNFFRPIDGERVSRHPIDYDIAFEAEYMERLNALHEAIEKGAMP